MLLKALDLLRTLGWGIINFIYSLIDSLFDILREINALDIINSLSGESMFKNFYTGIIEVAITCLGLFSVFNFVKKIIDPEEGLSFGQIVKEVFKCGILVLMSTFLFVQISGLSIKLSGFTSTIFTSNNESLSSNMLTPYVTYSDSYKSSESFVKDDYSSAISDGKFSSAKMYNDKFVTDSHWILPDEKDYKYSINWIMAILVGGFFLYALFFSGMMLARRQIEFLFLFVISPIIFSTSIGNKQRRSAVFEQLVSLILQGAVVMLIIGLTAMLMKSIQGTTFFPTSSFKDMATKSILYIGCGTFLLTGSQIINRFVGANVSANSGREQLMSMMGFSRSASTVAMTSSLAAAGIGLIGTGMITKGASSLSNTGNSAITRAGSTISSFGKKVSSSNTPFSNYGSKLQNLGNYIQASSIARKNPMGSDGMNLPNNSTKMNRLASRMMTAGADAIQSSIDTVIPTRNMYRRRFYKRGDN